MCRICGKEDMVQKLSLRLPRPNKIGATNQPTHWNNPATAAPCGATSSSVLRMPQARFSEAYLPLTASPGEV